MGGIIRAVSVFALLCSAPSGCSNEGDSSGGRPASSDKETSTKALAAIHASLEKIRDAMPPVTGLTEKPCPDDQITTWSPDAKHRTAALISYKELLRKTGAEVPDEERSPITDSMSSFSMNWIRPKGDDGRIDERLAGRWEREHYLAVIRKAAESGPNASQALGGKFEGGQFDGWLVFFRKETAEPICAARVQARSSSATAYSRKAGDRLDDMQRKAEHAVKEDLKRQVGMAMVAATERISNSLKLFNPAL